MPFRRSNSESQIDELAGIAYLLGHSEPESPPCMGVLLRRILGPGMVRLIDIGTPGTAKIETRRIHDGPTGIAPSMVLIPCNQTDEQKTLSAAYGCALYVGWARLCIFGDIETWDETRVRAVALAIAMPLEAIEPMIRAGANVREIAERFAVDPAVAAERMRLIVGGAKHDSGERPAVDGCASGVHSVARAGCDESAAELPKRRASSTPVR